MSTKAIRTILLLTLLQVAGQLLAFDNVSCDMVAPSTTEDANMEHDAHPGMNHGTDKSTGQSKMSCCDMSSGCTMATCLAIMLAPVESNMQTAESLEPLWILKPLFLASQVDPLYKPPILS